MIAPYGLQAGSRVISSDKDIDILPGNALLLRHIPAGTNIYNIELKPRGGGQLVRSAGCLAQLMAKEGDYAQIKLPSGEVRKVWLDCRATIGQVGNLDHENISIGKAGRVRWSGRSPHSRGTAMNPVDHPHGGGHGKDHGGRNPVTPWGVPTRGYKTRMNKRTDRYILKDRRVK
jgi:large subunit ribosomal protein L2